MFVKAFVKDISLDSFKTLYERDVSSTDPAKKTYN